MFSKTSTNKFALIIPGSGPTDHNGNNPLGLTASTYKLLAEGLAQEGIQSVRFDKRGMFASKSAVTDGNDVTIADYADDVVAWMPYDPAEKIKSIELPILILQGDNDLQVKLTDANRLPASAPSAKLVIIPNVNHILKEVKSDSVQENAETYSNPDLPIASEVIQQVVKFINP